MPYINGENKTKLGEIGNLHKLGANCESSGELNYAITELIQGYLYSKGLRYSYINDVVGALEGAKLEFYRRIAAPYEDNKIEENGDVYFLNVNS